MRKMCYKGIVSWPETS